VNSHNVKNNVIYWSTTPEQGTSPYVDLIVQGVRNRGWKVESISLLKLVAARNCIIHIQWPEHVSRGKWIWWTVAKHFRALALLGIIDLYNHRIVITAHNRSPHGKNDRFDQWFRRQTHKRAKATVVLVQQHEIELRHDGLIPQHSLVQPIPHPLSFAVNQNNEHNPSGPLVILGQIHPYHLIEPFIDALSNASNQQEVLVIGQVGDASLASRLERRSQQVPWLSVKPGYVGDSELLEILANSAAVVSLQLNTFNSGGPYAALPLGIPVILSEGAQAEQLTKDLGTEWVFSLPEQMSAEDVTDLKPWIAMERTSIDLSQYAMDKIIQDHIKLYELL